MFFFVEFAGTYFFGLNNASDVMVSSDCVTWQKPSIPLKFNSFHSNPGVSYIPDLKLYVLLGEDGYIATASDPTEDWQVSYKLPTIEELYSIGYIDGNYVVVGDTSLIYVGN